MHAFEFLPFAWYTCHMYTCLSLQIQLMCITKDGSFGLCNLTNIRPRDVCFFTFCLNKISALTNLTVFVLPSCLVKLTRNCKPGSQCTNVS